MARVERAFFLLISLAVLHRLPTTEADSCPEVPVEELTAKYWKDVGQSVLRSHLRYPFKRKSYEQEERSAIFIVGAGMSLTTVRAAGLLKAQARKTDNSLHFEKFPIVGMSKTYCSDYQVSDEACSATSFSNGILGRSGTIGLTPTANSSECLSSRTNQMKSIADWALAAGKDIGIVTNSRLTHPLITGMYGHSVNASWESDADVLESASDPRVCSDFAQQLIMNDPGRRFKVILGGGRENLLPTTFSSSGRRRDGRNLIDEWKNDKKHKGYNFKYVTNAMEMFGISDRTEYLLGLFSNREMDYHLNGKKSQPALEEMVETAIRILSKSQKGYFLFVLAGNIRKAHGQNQAKYALDETLELSKAVARADALTEPDDTLIVLTADAGNTMTISGYPSRFNDILGMLNEGDLVHPTLSYATGPGYKLGYSVENATEFFKNISSDVNYKYPAGAPLAVEARGGEDVPVFARGPWQQIFTGVYNAYSLPHLIGYATCIGPGKRSCDKSSSVTGEPSFYLLACVSILSLLKFYH